MSDIGDPARKSRTLVLCFDGTAEQYDAENTNVVKFFALLKKDNLEEQLCYYQPGIGTWFNPGVVAPIFRWGARVLDEAFAWYLDTHVIEGYKFLMQNYCVGDRVCIFGFSRGSYTARALAGLLHKVGLLPKDNEQQIPFAYKLYKRVDQSSLELCAGFKQTFCYTVKIEFMGVWDTVANIGIIMGRSLPFTNSNKTIKTFRHALSLDEHRAKFRPSYYHRPLPNDGVASADPQQSPPLGGKDLSSKSGDSDTVRLVSPKRPGWLSRLLNRRMKIFLDYNVEEDGKDTDIMEVWFSGCHSDVGGGAVKDATIHDLANISLRWMVQEAMRAECGIQFDELALIRAAIPTVLSPVETAPDPTTLDERDALEPIHDELKANMLWWLLEIIPTNYLWQDANGIWHKEFNLHLGRGRKILDPKPIFHATVKQRIESQLKYTPKARWTAGSEIYIH